MRANAAYIYIRGEFVYEAVVLEHAIKQAYDAPNPNPNPNPNPSPNASTPSSRPTTRA